MDHLMKLLKCNKMKIRKQIILSVFFSFQTKCCTTLTVKMKKVFIFLPSLH